MDTMELIEMAKKGHKEARDRLVTENIGLVHHTVRRFANRGYDIEDLFQIGTIGLIKSIDKFDSSFDVRFSTYAVPMIMGEIRRFLRDDGMIKVSRSLKDTANKVRITKSVLNNRMNREPTIAEIATEIGIAEEEIVMALESNAEIESLHKTIYQGDGNAIFLIDKLIETKDENELMVDKLALREAIESLGENERKIIKLRYFSEKTQTEVGNELGISQVQVSRMEKKILKLMREMMS